MFANPIGASPSPPLSLATYTGFRKFLLADATREGENTNPLVDALGDAATFNWALECVLSRAFQLPPDDAAAPVFDEDDDVPVKAPELTPPAPEATRMALLPLVDSINHYSRIPTHMYWEEDGALSLSGGGCHTLVVSALRFSCCTEVLGSFGV